MGVTKDDMHYCLDLFRRLCNATWKPAWSQLSLETQKHAMLRWVYLQREETERERQTNRGRKTDREYQANPTYHLCWPLSLQILILKRKKAKYNFKNTQAHTKRHKRYTTNRGQLWVKDFCCCCLFQKGLLSLPSKKSTLSTSTTKPKKTNRNHWYYDSKHIWQKLTVARFAVDSVACWGWI